MTEDAHGEGIEAEDAERLALEAAIAEARASGPGVPHAVVRKRLMEMIAEARARTAATLARSRAADGTEG